MKTWTWADKATPIKHADLDEIYGPWFRECVAERLPEIYAPYGRRKPRPVLDGGANDD